MERTIIHSLNLRNENLTAICFDLIIQKYELVHTVKPALNGISRNQDMHVFETK
jgi:hypothetical protein